MPGTRGANSQAVALLSGLVLKPIQTTQLLNSVVEDPAVVLTI